MIELSQNTQLEQKSLVKPALSFIGGRQEDYREFTQVFEPEFEISIVATSDDLLNNSKLIRPKVILLISEFAKVPLLEDVRRLKNALPTCPIILFTNQINPYMWHELIKLDVRYIFQRPTSLARVVDLCKCLCDVEIATISANSSTLFPLEHPYYHCLKWKTKLGETIANLCSNFRDQTKSFMIESPSRALHKSTISLLAHRGSANAQNQDPNQLCYLTELDLMNNDLEMNSLFENISENRKILGSRTFLDSLFRNGFISSKLYNDFRVNSIRFPAPSECIEDVATLVYWWSLMMDSSLSDYRVVISKCAKEWLINLMAQHDWAFILSLIEEVTQEAMKHNRPIREKDCSVARLKLLYGDGINDVETFPQYFDRLTDDYRKAFSLIREKWPLHGFRSQLFAGR